MTATTEIVIEAREGRYGSWVAAVAGGELVLEGATGERVEAEWAAELLRTARDLEG